MRRLVLFDLIALFMAQLESGGFQWHQVCVRRNLPIDHCIQLVFCGERPIIARAGRLTASKQSRSSACSNGMPKPLQWQSGPHWAWWLAAYSECARSWSAFRRPFGDGLHNSAAPICCPLSPFLALCAGMDALQLWPPSLDPSSWLFLWSYFGFSNFIRFYKFVYILTRIVLL